MQLSRPEESLFCVTHTEDVSSVTQCPLSKEWHISLLLHDLPMLDCRVAKAGLDVLLCVSAQVPGI